MKDQQFKRAGDIFREVARKHPYCASFAENIVICEMNENRFYDAIGELKRLVMDAPHCCRYYYLFSRAYANIGNLRLYN